MKREVAVLPCVAVLLLGSIGCSRKAKPTLVPAQNVEMDDKTLMKFAEEVVEYVELRKKAMTNVPPVNEKATADELTKRQEVLTRTIVAYRKGAKQGDIFKKDVEAAIRRILTREFTGPNGAALMKDIKEGNPKVEGNPQPQNPTREVKQTVNVAVNAIYTDGAPFSTVPGSLLLKLPLLPDEVRYRFVGRALIIRDTEANLILDYILDVVPDPTTPR